MKLSTNPTLMSADSQPEGIIELETIDNFKVKNQSNPSLLQKRSHRLISTSQSLYAGCRCLKGMFTEGNSLNAENGETPRQVTRRTLNSTHHM